MLPPVVIEVTAARPERPELDAMLEACARAVGEAPCVLAREAPEAPYAAVAIVTLVDDEHVRVEVGSKDQGQSEWRSRDLVFRSGDVEIERWRAIGFVVGSLAGATATESDGSAAPQRLPAPKDSTQPSAHRPSSSESPAEAPSERTHRYVVGLGLLLGDELDGEPTRLGVSLRAGIRPTESPFLLRLSLGYAVGGAWRPDLRTSFLDGRFGIGWVVYERQALSLDLTAGIGPERLSVQATRGSESDEKARWLGVGSLGPVLAVYPSESWGICSSAEVLLRGGRTEIVSGVDSAGNVGRVGYDLWVGACARDAR